MKPFSDWNGIFFIAVFIGIMAVGRRFLGRDEDDPRFRKRFGWLLTLAYLVAAALNPLAGPGYRHTVVVFSIIALLGVIVWWKGKNCPSCGAPVSGLLYLGTPARFCPYCGAALVAAEKPKPPTDPLD